MLAHACTAPFWLTETGQTADPTDATALTNQATHYTTTLEAMNGRPWWTATIFYEAFDEPGSGSTWGVSVHNTSNAAGYDAKPALGVLADWVFPPPGPDAGLFLDGGSGVTGTGAGATDGGALADGGDENGNAGATSNGDASGGDNGSGCSAAPSTSIADLAYFLGTSAITFSLQRSRRRRRPR